MKRNQPREIGVEGEALQIEGMACAKALRQEKPGRKKKLKAEQDSRATNGAETIDNSHRN